MLSFMYLTGQREHNKIDLCVIKQIELEAEEELEKVHRTKLHLSTRLSNINNKMLPRKKTHIFTSVID